MHSADICGVTGQYQVSFAELGLPPEGLTALLQSGLSTSSNTLLLQDPLPHLPIMVSTRLQLDWLLSDSVIDLRAVTEVILADAGATLQILRLIGEEYPNQKDRPSRLEDCLVSLSMERCYEAICASDMSHPGPYVAEWQRCRRVAECAREVATCYDGFCSEEAYLVGLLSRLGTFPNLLGWGIQNTVCGEQRSLGAMLAVHWHLPDYLCSAIKDGQESETSAKWKSILQLADRLAAQPVA